MKFKILQHPDIPEKVKLGQRDRILLFCQGKSCKEIDQVGKLYDEKKEEDGWLYLDFIIESPMNPLRGL